MFVLGLFDLHLLIFTTHELAHPFTCLFFLRQGLLGGGRGLFLSFDLIFRFILVKQVFNPIAHCYVVFAIQFGLSDELMSNIFRSVFIQPEVKGYLVV